MKIGKGLMGLATAAILMVGASSVQAMTTSLAQQSLDREISAPEVPPYTGHQSTVSDRQNRVLGSIARDILDREVNPPKVPAYTGHQSTVSDNQNRAPGSIAQKILDLEV